METSRILKIHGQEYTIDLPYREGHPLTAIEASTVNQLWSSRISGLVGTRYTSGKAKAEKDGTTFELYSQEEFDAVAKAYEFQERAARGTGADPIAKGILAHATATVKAALKTAGYTIGGQKPDYKPSSIKDMAQLVIDAPENAQMVADWKAEVEASLEKQKAINETFVLDNVISAAEATPAE